MTGPIAAVRVAHMGEQGDGHVVTNPSRQQLEEAGASLLYAGTADRCTFIELQVRPTPFFAQSPNLVRLPKLVWQCLGMIGAFLHSRLTTVRCWLLAGRKRTLGGSAANAPNCS